MTVGDDYLHKAAQFSVARNESSKCYRAPICVWPHKPNATADVEINYEPQRKGSPIASSVGDRDQSNLHSERAG
jgi:hypothetical protein